MSSEPRFEREETSEGARLRLAGRWTVEASGVEARANEIVKSGDGVVALDLSAVEAMDTAGAWLVDRSRARIGPAARIEGARQEYAILLKEAA